MKEQSEWTWVHYKILDCSDGFHLPELLQRHDFIGFRGSNTMIPSSDIGETKAALIDLVEAGAVDVFDQDERLSPEQAVLRIGDDSFWSFEDRASELEIADNARTGEFIAARPEDQNPHQPLDAV